MPKNTKFIVVTGGVMSGLGKGVAAASIGNLLSSSLKVVPMKLDGYLNTDPGTMNPIEHGEVFVLDDGGEVDMDFGHYERFLGTTCKREWNLTMGKVFTGVNEKERRGDYLGKTVQMIPHGTNYIKEVFFETAKQEAADVLLIEIGGTVGDIENQLYIEAARQLKKQVGPNNILYVHLTYVPIPYGVNEQKSKPTQQSVDMLRQRGIQPDIVIGRCTKILDQKIKEKIASFCDVDETAVFTGLDVPHVYSMPLLFESEGMLKVIANKLGIEVKPDTAKWKSLIDNLDDLKQLVTVAICGKYTKLEDSYASIKEALLHCSAHTKAKIKIDWVDTAKIENKQHSLEERLKDVDAVIIPGGFGPRGVEGKIEVIRYVREKNIPFMGICLGLQLAVVEYARNVCNLAGAHSTEMNPTTEHPVVDILPEQKNVDKKGGTMRLGAYKAVLAQGSLASRLYASDEVWERHRHRYEVNPSYHMRLSNAGLRFSGMSEDRRLAEFIELADHPFFIATQAHPELKSSLLKPAPLFLGLVNAALAK
ncbi:CTP synthase (glutamine hydrolyzing) [Candidatus Woesearchaeota archaeon]|nr:CTP synthase (glutamine hydrolyzing) [Candidatus Woesearchaeota archaeon]